MYLNINIYRKPVYGKTKDLKQGAWTLSNIFIDQVPWKHTLHASYHRMQSVDNYILLINHSSRTAQYNAINPFQSTGDNCHPTNVIAMFEDKVGIDG